MARPREEWVHDVESRYRALENFTQEDARLQFLRILRTLPYGAPPLWVPRPPARPPEQGTRLYDLPCSLTSALLTHRPPEVRTHRARNSTTVGITLRRDN